jgi:hypothetical protein
MTRKQFIIFALFTGFLNRPLAYGKVQFHIENRLFTDVSSTT